MEKTINVLLVEDDEDDSLLLREKLAISESLVHFDIQTVHKCADAIQALKASAFDIMLLDLGLPDSKGLETLERILDTDSRIPIVVMTGMDDLELSIRSVQLGAQDYILKGELSSGSLIRTMSHAIERKRIQEELRSANRTILEQQQELLEEERVKVLMQMAGATAHELNQPLQSLMGFVELLNDGKGSEEENEQALDFIKQSAEKMRNIVSRIQTLHRYETKAKANTKQSAVEFAGVHHLLLVEDSDDSAARLEIMLSKYEKYLKLHRARSYNEAQRKIKEHEYDLILCDYALPDGTGLDLVEQTRASMAISPPFIMITGKGSEKLAVESVHRGVYDYFSKSEIDRDALSRSIWTTLERTRLEHSIQIAQKRIAEMATQDELTGLHNRRYFMEALKMEWERAKRYKHPMTLGMLDLDRFKQVNDTYGHPVGDHVLRKTGELFREMLRTSDIVGRYGGEEFIFVLGNTPLENSRTLAERIRERLAHISFQDNHGATFSITCSIGLASISDDIKSPSELIEAADHALFEAKEKGRDRVCQS
ncbi:MAG: diguanylate cyclase [Candidatus Sumerlaeia bacterium]